MINFIFFWNFFFFLCVSLLLTYNTNLFLFLFLSEILWISLYVFSSYLSVVLDDVICLSIPFFILTLASIEFCICLIFLNTMRMLNLPETAVKNFNFYKN